jgi:hypothetical protein
VRHDHAKVFRRYLDSQPQGSQRPHRAKAGPASRSRRKIWRLAPYVEFESNPRSTIIDVNAVKEMTDERGDSACPEEIKQCIVRTRGRLSSCQSAMISSRRRVSLLVVALLASNIVWIGVFFTCRWRQTDKPSQVWLSQSKKTRPRFPTHCMLQLIPLEHCRCLETSCNDRFPRKCAVQHRQQDFVRPAMGGMLPLAMFVAYTVSVARNYCIVLDDALLHPLLRELYHAAIALAFGEAVDLSPSV